MTIEAPLDPMRKAHEDEFFIRQNQELLAKLKSNLGPPMIDHLSINVSDFDKSKRFYEKALLSLGLRIVSEPEAGVAGFGKNDRASYWIIQAKKPTTNFHAAFASDTREAVDAFWKSAIEAGGRDNGKPGLRTEYHPDYYGAFIFDPDGNNIEAVCQTKPPAKAQ